MRRSSWVLAGLALGGVGLLGGAPSCAGELQGDPASYKVERSTGGACDATPVFTKRCAAVCHSTAQMLGALDLTSPGVEARLVGVNSKSKGCEPRLLVDPSDPSKSFLLEKVENTTPECGDQMPQVGNLTDEELACIQSWVFGLGSGDGGGVSPTSDASVAPPNADSGAGKRDAGGMP